MKARKVLWIVVVALAMLCAACNQTSETKMYHLEGIGLSLEAPGNLYAYTRNMEEDDPLFEQFETNLQGVAHGLKAGNSYLHLFDQEKTFGVDVCYMMSETEDYKMLDEAGQDKLLKEYQQSFQNGPELHESEIRTVGDETYVFMHYSADAIHMWRWATNRNNRLYYVTLTARNRETGEQQLPWVEDMMEHIVFDGA